MAAGGRSMRARWRGRGGLAVSTATLDGADGREARTTLSQPPSLFQSGVQHWLRDRAMLGPGSAPQYVARQWLPVGANSCAGPGLLQPCRWRHPASPVLTG